MPKNPPQLEALPSDAVVGEELPADAIVGAAATSTATPQAQPAATPQGQLPWYKSMDHRHHRDPFEVLQQWASRGRETIQGAGDKGQLSPAMTGVGTFAAGSLESIGKMGHGAVQPKNAALATAGMVPGLQIPVGAAMAGMGGKQMYDATLGKDKNAPMADRLESGLQGAAGVVGGAATMGARPATALLEKNTAVEHVSNAINPLPKDMPGLRETLEGQMDTLARTAKESGKPIRTMKDFVDVAERAAENDPYRKTFIEPNRAVEVNLKENSIKGYKGDTMGGTGDPYASVAQLDERLSTINKTLRPRYESGGSGSPSATSKVGAEQAQALAKEATDIRLTLSKVIGQKMGIAPDFVYNARANYGQLKEIAWDAQFSIDEMARGSNKIKNQPIKVGTIYPKVKNIQLSPRSGADARVARVFSKYQPQAAAQPQAVPPPQQPPVKPRTPVWEGKTEAGQAPPMETPQGMTPTQARSAREGAAFDRQMGRVTGQPEAKQTFSLGQPTPVQGAPDVMEYPINKGGSRVGHARVAIKPDGTADVGWLGPDKRGAGGNLGLGSEGVKELMRQIKRDHPEIKRFSGLRTGRTGSRRLQQIDSLNPLGQ
jgi:hypothetical protein